MNQSEQPIISILAEGGSIILYKTNDNFLFYTSEIIDLAENFIVKKVPQQFPSFSEAFLALQNTYPIFNLHLDEVHPTYVSELKETLNLISQEDLVSTISWSMFISA